MHRKVPETKNRTFEEIASQFQPGGDIDVEEIVNDDDDVFGLVMTSAQGAGRGDDQVKDDYVTPALTQFAVQKTDEDRFWVVRL